MKVLKDNYNNYNEISPTEKIEPYPRKLICESCMSELEYVESDLRMGVLGCMHIDCPLCGNGNMIEDDENSITLTIDSVEFPVHFFHTSKDNGAKDCLNNEEVRICIRKAITYFREHKDEFAWSTRYGNLFIVVFRFDGDGEYEVIVSGDHYSTYIPFDEKDLLED